MPPNASRVKTTPIHIMATPQTTKNTTRQDLKLSFLKPYNINLPISK